MRNIINQPNGLTKHIQVLMQNYTFMEISIDVDIHRLENNRMISNAGHHFRSINFELKTIIYHVYQTHQ